MVKGITRQVILVKSPDPKLFEEAIFIVKEEALAREGVSADQVLRQAIEEVGLERLDLPEGVESAIRGEGDSRVRILLNHNDISVQALGQELAPFQVKVLPMP